MNIIFPIVLFILFMAPPVMIAQLARKGSLASGKDIRQANTIFALVLAFFLVYLAYVGIASVTGLFDEAMLPPKIMRFTFIPLWIFYVLVIFNLPIYKRILGHLPAADLIKIHVFRIIGGSFLVLGLMGHLPMVIALIAGLGDLTIAITAPFVGQAVHNKKPYAKRLALVWNIFGLLDIIATSVLALLLTKWSMDTGSQGVEVLASFPFCFIPAFAPATIIFLHISFFKKLKSI